MRRILPIAILALLWGSTLMGQSNLTVSGLGFFQDRSMDARLSFLNNVESDVAIDLDAAILEDSAFLLLEQMKRKGYLEPTIEGRMCVGDTERSVYWQGDYAIQLEVDFVAEAVEFIITPGVLSYYDAVVVDGVHAIEAKQVERFFIPGGVLFSGKKARVFTYENFERRQGRLLRALDDLGYRSAQVVNQQIDIDPVSGAVQVELTIEQGPLYQIGELEIVITRAGGEHEVRKEPAQRVVFTREWEQAKRAALRNEAYRAGYPDATVSSEIVADSEEQAGVILRHLRYRVDYGQAVTLQQIEFDGDTATKRSVLKRQVELKAGEPLDLIAVSEARRQLMGLGIFQEVGLQLEPTSGDARSVVYALSPSQRKELQLRAGWGSYEQARLGFRWEHRSPWGRAHRYEVEVKQSFKSTLGEATYSIPQFLGTELTTYLNAEYNYREELSFDRRAQGMAVGTSMQLSDTGLRLAVEYGFSQENADRLDLVSFESEEDATVASVTFKASLDRRDDFLAPSSGYSLYASLETAGQWLGGSVNFQKLELGGSYHSSLSESILFHAGLQGGTIFTTGAAEDNIPFNERFFSGGENSVRGYVEGGASPRDSGGDEVGSESYLLLNLELEQRIYSQLSTVFFFDSVLNARDGFFDREREVLSSIGFGLRYQTVVGPLRLEYGHNLNPRDSDSDGALHFSIGFPF
ncbi:BamA/TamA family outer membrane protein [Coraliomargarita algicola]|uniref:BamA/TamA family outer membrane protein n=1 Tax=Coraliomargarita algicola TaxID=3092156 RepID=A0ABZ0RHP7_9BACT|nr:BamA/TamA family outer membrane protein [Coraliomargarita sp. J2-16]WPJ94779.1 BamA/TamA family outer membrane protein [Coraliomargarita sp. J2-16]